MLPLERVLGVPSEQPSYQVIDIVHLLLLKCNPKSWKVLWKDKAIKVAGATGSIKSIRQWAVAAFGMDKNNKGHSKLLLHLFF